MLQDYKKFETRKQVLNDFQGTEGDQDLDPKQMNPNVGNTSMMSIDDSSKEQTNAQQYGQRPMNAY